MFSVLSSLSIGVFATLGLLVFFLVFVRGMKPPADKSNRLAHLILVWEALKSPHRFVGVRHPVREEVMFKYLEQDIKETVRRR